MSIQLITLSEKNFHNKIAKFLEHQGYPEQALQVSTDSDHQLDLALSLGKLHFAQVLDLIFFEKK